MNQLAVLPIAFLMKIEPDKCNRFLKCFSHGGVESEVPYLEVPGRALEPGGGERVAVGQHLVGLLEPLKHPLLRTDHSLHVLKGKSKNKISFASYCFEENGYILLKI